MFSEQTYYEQIEALISKLEQSPHVDLKRIQNISQRLQDLKKRIEEEESFKQIFQIEEEFEAITRTLKYPQLHCYFNDEIHNLSKTLEEIPTYTNQELIKVKSELEKSLNKFCSGTNVRLCEDEVKVILNGIEEVRSDLKEFAGFIEGYDGNKDEGEERKLIDEGLFKLFLRINEMDDGNDERLKAAKMEVIEEIRRNMMRLSNKVLDAYDPREFCKILNDVL